MKLDLIENIEIHEEVSTLTNFHSIPQLLEGIFMTYNSIKRLQENYWRIKYPNASESFIDIYKSASFSFIGELNQADAQAVNLFHWYSINLVNYAKCCGLVKFLNLKGILPEYLAGNKLLIGELINCQSEYIQSIPELVPVIHFRNKAAAHLAYTSPKNEDNPATLIESMSILPALINGKFYVGAVTRKRGEYESSFANNSWSLEENFDSLIPRYFKEHIG